MIRRALFWLWAIALLSTIASAQTIEIQGPSQPVPTGRVVIIDVIGLNSGLSFECSPEATDFYDFASGDNRKVIFMSTNPGQHKITVTLNDWTGDLEDAVESLQNVATTCNIVLSEPSKQALDDAVASLQTVSATITTENPASSGSCIVEVSGTPDPTPVDPVDPTPDPSFSWEVRGGLHVLIMDDENQRGHLPQSQVNMFTSRPFHEWLEANTAKGTDGEPAYRMTSNDSLQPGEEARDLELPVYVDGWDLIDAAVEQGRMKLPTWIVSNGERGVIEPLPVSVEAAIARLEGFK